MGILILSIAYYVAMISLVTNAGSKKEIGGLNTFLISLLFSPILGMLFVINSKEITEQVEDSEDSSSTKPNNINSIIGILILIGVFTYAIIYSIK